MLGLTGRRLLVCEEWGWLKRHGLVRLLPRHKALMCLLLLMMMCRRYRLLTKLLVVKGLLEYLLRCWLTWCRLLRVVLSMHCLWSRRLSLW